MAETAQPTRASVIPAIATTFLVGCGFAALKFVLIGRIALDWDPSNPVSLEAIPWQWLRDVLLNSHAKGTFAEATSQAMSVVLTLGLLLGFPINGPLAGAWRCDRLFAVSSALVGFGCIMALFSNPWVWACFIGITYGAACSARGKIVPLLSLASGYSNTRVSGGINAALAIGLIAGTISGSFISQTLPGHAVVQHAILVAIAAIAVSSALFIRVPEPQVVPFGQGLRDFFRATGLLFRHHWPLLAGGGLAWGITAAASLAMYVHANQELGLERGPASTLAGIAAAGAILGNIVSHHYTRRRYVGTAFVLLAATLAAYPYVAVGLFSAACMVFCIGFLFAAPANVLDAKFLANAHDEDLAGLGGTVMSFVHSFAILAIGISLAVPLFLGLMRAHDQFWVLAGIALASSLATIWAKLGDSCSGAPPLRP